MLTKENIVVALKQFDNICKKFNVEYTVFGASALLFYDIDIKTEDLDILILDASDEQEKNITDSILALGAKEIQHEHVSYYLFHGVEFHLFFIWSIEIPNSKLYESMTYCDFKFRVRRLSDIKYDIEFYLKHLRRSNEQEYYRRLKKISKKLGI